MLILVVISLVLAGIVFQFESTKPDGLEWSLLNISDSVVMQTQGLLFSMSEAIQNNLSVLSSMSYGIGNIAGVLLVVVFMYITFLMLGRKVVFETNEK